MLPHSVGALTKSLASVRSRDIAFAALPLQYYMQTLTLSPTFASTKSLASKNFKFFRFEYIGIQTILSDVFFDADSESPPMT